MKTERQPRHWGGILGKRELELHPTPLSGRRSPRMPGGVEGWMAVTG